jgi:hypothetical protein
MKTSTAEAPASSFIMCGTIDEGCLIVGVYSIGVLSVGCVQMALTVAAFNETASALVSR